MPPQELERASENVKARIVLALESSGSGMNRLGGSILFGLPLLEPDELMARIDAVSLDDLRGLVAELWPADRLSAAGIGPRRGRLPRGRRARRPRGPRG